MNNILTATGVFEPFRDQLPEIIQKAGGQKVSAGTTRSCPQGWSAHMQYRIDYILGGRLSMTVWLKRLARTISCRLLINTANLDTSIGSN